MAGSVGTLDWPPAAVATVVAASLALLGSAVTIVWGVERWRREQTRVAQQERWSRVVWVVEQVCSGDVGRQEVGLRAARVMYDMQRTGRSDGSFERVLLELIVEGSGG